MSDRPRSTIALHRIAILCVPLALFAAACGVPTGENSFEEVDDAASNALNQSTSTTTTTTTPPTTTTPDEPIVTTETTTTTTEPAGDAVTIYFLSRRLVARATRLLPPGLSPDENLIQLLNNLEAGPTELEDNSGYDTVVDRGLIRGVPRIVGGVINVELNTRIFERISSRDQPLALAQIVFTFLQNTVAAGQVAFFIDGEPISIPTDSGLRDVASTDDFQSLDPRVPATSSTTTSSTTTSSTSTSLPASIEGQFSDPPTTTR